MNKKELLLNTMIQEYIKYQEPIGSESLKILLDVKISSATIRNYFKMLGDEGIVVQPHISSGRIPTSTALKNYWEETLNPLELHPTIPLDKMDALCESFEVTCIIRQIVPQKLLRIIEVESTTLVLIFEHNTIAIPLTANMKKFCEELIGLDIEDIKKIAKSVCATHLLQALGNFAYAPRTHFFGLEFLANLLQKNSNIVLNILQGEVFQELENTIFFPKQTDYLMISHQANLNNKEAKMLCVGRLEKNYELFYQQIA